MLKLRVGEKCDGQPNASMTSGPIERRGKDAPSTVATSDTAVETLSVSTTLAQTSRPVVDGARADGDGGRSVSVAARGGGNGRRGAISRGASHRERKDEG